MRRKRGSGAPWICHALPLPAPRPFAMRVLMSLRIMHCLSAVSHTYIVGFVDNTLKSKSQRLSRMSHNVSSQTISAHQIRGYGGKRPQSRKRLHAVSVKPCSDSVLRAQLTMFGRHQAPLSCLATGVFEHSVLGGKRMHAISFSPCSGSSFPCSGCSVRGRPYIVRRTPRSRPGVGQITTRCGPKTDSKKQCNRELAAV